MKFLYLFGGYKRQCMLHPKALNLLEGIYRKSVPPDSHFEHRVQCDKILVDGTWLDAPPDQVALEIVRIHDRNVFQQLLLTDELLRRAQHDPIHPCGRL